MPLDDILVAGVPLILVIPACVELAKRAGLPTRYAGIAAVVSGILLLALSDLALTDSASWPNWIIGGIVYGLAASGLYSQRNVLPKPTSHPDTAT
jgi:hypothetical protein